MSKKLLETANALSANFMPAEKAQSTAAIHAARSLVVALEARGMPEFANPRGDAAVSELVRGISHSVEADAAFRAAHRGFARLVGSTGLPELGWGCTDPDCPPVIEPRGEVEGIRTAA